MTQVAALIADAWTPPPAVRADTARGTSGGAGPTTTGRVTSNRLAGRTSGAATARTSSATTGRTGRG